MPLPPVPVVVFGFKRPDKLERILARLRPEGVARLVIFIDGPRSAADLPAVEACRNLARGVDWTPADLHLWEDNHGLPGLVDNITIVLEDHPAAIFVEDDCLPMPGFAAFMQKALVQYQDNPQVFSIGAYQPLPVSFFKDRTAALVSSARFLCWGWATWRDRWQTLLPDIRRYAELFDGLKTMPDLAGADLPLMARKMAAGEMGLSWDVQVAVAALYHRKVHLLATRGLVRNIGLDRSGFHGGLGGALRDRLLQNRNVVEAIPDGLVFPEAVDLDLSYSAALAHFAHQAQAYSPRRLLQRGRTLARRYLLPGRERLFDLDLRPAPAPAEKRALLSYIVHPFSITRGDPRFFRHINIYHAQEMVRAMNEMGYRVDVIDYRDTKFVPRRDYDLFIGHGGVNFTRLAGQLPARTPKIFLSTGSYWRFHNEREAQRFRDLEQRRGVRLRPDRPIEADEESALRLADSILGIGNSVTRSTYAGFERVEMINGTSLDDAHYDWCLRTYNSTRCNFLYFASNGSVHKGLDRALEAFSGLEQHLWIMAPVDPAFANAYREELQHRPNIHLLGWVQPRSAQFYETMWSCGFCILPSCSEGQSQSVVEAMNHGLVPLVTHSAGVSVDGFGVYLEPPGIEDIRCVVKECAQLAEDELRRRSALARQAVLDHYSEARFGPSFTRALERLLAARAP